MLNFLPLLLNLFGNRTVIVCSDITQCDWGLYNRGQLNTEKDVHDKRLVRSQEKLPPNQGKKKTEEELSLKAAGASDLEILASRNVISSSQPLVLCCGSLSKRTAVHFSPHSQIYVLRLGERRELDHR